VSGRGIPGTNAIWVEKAVGPTGAPYEIIHVPNTLAAKAGEFRAATAPIEKVNSLVDSLRTQYPERTAADLARAVSTWRRLQASMPADEVARQELARLAHDFRGTGKTYGYPLVSVVSETLYALVAGPAVDRPLGRAAIEAHVNALVAVLHGRMAGDGGGAGQTLIAGLKAAAAKAQQAPAAAD
jgi:hypothetical protein